MRHGYEDFVRAMLARRPAPPGARAPRSTRRWPGTVPDAGDARASCCRTSPVDGRGLAWQPNLAVLLRAMPELTGFPAQPAPAAFTGPAGACGVRARDYVDAAGEAALRRLFPRIEIATVPDAGHWPHAERPAAFRQRC